MGGAEETKCSGGLGSGLGLTRPRVTWWYALDWGWGQAPRGSVADLPGGFKQVTSCPLVSLCFGCTASENSWEPPDSGVQFATSTDS